MITKLDYYLASMVGFIAGVFAIPIIVNLGLRTHFVLFVIPLVAPVLFIAGLWVVDLVSRRLPVFAQFGKFVAVGLSSTAIDFGVLNILSMTTGVTAGFILGGVNMPGFSVAVISSYFWNKFWTFRAGGNGGVMQDFPKFLAVATVGLILNSGLIILITTFVPPFFGAGASTHLNLAKIVATIFVFSWNFLGMKFLVFKK